MAGLRKSGSGTKQRSFKPPQHVEEYTKNDKISHLQSLNKLLLQEIKNLRQERDDFLKKDKEREQEISDAQEQLKVFEENAKKKIGTKELEWTSEKQNLVSSILQLTEKMIDLKEAWILEKERMLSKMKEIGEELNSIRFDKHEMWLQLKKTWDEMEVLSAEKDEFFSQLKETGEEIILLHSEKNKLLLMLNETGAKLISFNENEGKSIKESIHQLLKAKKKLQKEILKKEGEFKASVLEVETKWKESSERLEETVARKEDELQAMISVKNKLEDDLFILKESKVKEARNEIESLHAEKAFLASEKMFLAWSIDANKGLQT